MRVFALAAALFVLLFAGVARAQDAALATRGQQLLQSKGCLACHSLDGSPRTGPTLGQFGRRKRLLTTKLGASEVEADEAYLGRAIRDPDQEIALGYKAGAMPKIEVTDDEVHAMYEALRHPELIDESKARRGGSIIPLAGSCAAFVFLHFFLSAIPVRRQIQLAISAKGFAAVYSIFAFAAFAGMVVFYRTAPFFEIWSPPRWTRWVPVLAMPIALLFMVAGFSTPSPTAAGQEKSIDEGRPIGIQAVTRHPALVGFALWAVAHLATNGELHVVLVAGAILVLAVGGMFHIDARRKAAMGAAWDTYASQTSRLPFAAIARGRARLVPSEIGLRRVIIAAVLYIVIFFAHPHVIGASPSP